MKFLKSQFLLAGVVVGCSFVGTEATTFKPKSEMACLPGVSGDFRRGINVNPWFRKPAIAGTWDRADSSKWRFSWPPFPIYDQESFRGDLVKLRKAGFDFLRVPIHVGPFLVVTPQQRLETFSNIGNVMDSALELGFNLMLNLQPSGPGDADYQAIAATPRSRQTYIDTVIDMTTAIGRKAPSRIIIETINEPTTKCGDPGWASFQASIIQAITAKYPDTRIAVTGSCYDNIQSLKQIKPSDFAIDQKYIYYTFHYYNPFNFTHQGNSWAGQQGLRATTGLEWPSARGNLEDAKQEIGKTAKQTEAYARYGSKIVDEAIKIADTYYRAGADEDGVRKEFQTVVNWADANGIPRNRIIMGEFGVLKRERRWFGASMASAARWISTVRKQAECAGMPWAIWSYKEGFALTESDIGNEYYPEITRALGLGYIR